MSDKCTTLTAKQIARGLIPHLAQTEVTVAGDKDDADVLEEFLLWPPDLFAFTSQILSITGAYHMAVSPPRYKNLHDYGSSERMQWPPDKNWICEVKKQPIPVLGEKDDDEAWVKEVRQVGLQWRKKLNSRWNSLEEVKKDLSECKKAEDPRRKEMIIERLGNLVENELYVSEESWIPKAVGDYWNKFRAGLSPKWNGNVADLLCDEKKQTDENVAESLQEDKDRKSNWDTFKALMTLHAIADETCSGWGIRGIDFKEDRKKTEEELELDETKVGKRSAAQMYAEELLENLGTLATINNQRCRILPKRHTPGVGITLRSLSANLAYHRSSIDVKWHVSFSSQNKPIENDLITRMGGKDEKNKKDKKLSVLLLPWPLDVHALDFKSVDADHVTMEKEKFGFFCYSPEKRDKRDSGKEKKDFENLLEYALETAMLETESVDIVVLPEGALTKTGVKWLESILQKDRYKVSFYVAGVRCNPQDENEPEQKIRRLHDNMVYFRMGNYKDKVTNHFAIPDSKPAGYGLQHKHHRWKLSHPQLINYHLGHRLSPSKSWWEAIKIHRRKVTFINIGEELTICPLICEDLARQDPIADLIRTAGPSIVITILNGRAAENESLVSKIRKRIGRRSGQRSHYLNILWHGQ